MRRRLTAESQLAPAGLGTIGMMRRLAIVGYGSWGPNYERVLRSLPNCSLTAVCDVNEDCIIRAKEDGPDLHVTLDLNDILADPRLDAVIVATPATSHYEVVKRVLEADKDCLVEKPLATDPTDARVLRDLAARRELTLLVGHIFRYNPAVNLVHHLLESDAIGKLEYASLTRTNLGPIRTDVNVVWDLMTHDVSILLHLVPHTPIWVSAQGAPFLTDHCEDVAFATIAFEGNVMANVRASWLDPRKVREVTLVGTRKAIVFDDVHPSEPVRIYDKGAMREPEYGSFGEFKMVTRSGDVRIPAVPAAEPLRTQCLDFLESVETRRRPLSHADDGVEVVDLVAAINQSMAERGKPIELRELIPGA